MLIPNPAYLERFEPASRGVMSDILWFAQNPSRRYRVRSVPPDETTELARSARCEYAPRYSLAACWRTEPGSLKINRRMGTCTRQQARNVELPTPDDALARCYFASPAGTYHYYIDGAVILAAHLPTVGGIQ